MDNWISDSLYNVLGISEKSIVDYVKTIAKSAKSVDKIEQGLKDLDFDVANQ